MKREDLFKRATERPPGRPADLVERLGRGRDLRHRMAWPGGTLELELQILTRGETAAAHAAAIAACAARGIDEKASGPRAVEARADEEMTQILAAAIRDPASHERLFKSGDELADLATDDELVALFNAYADHRHAVDPDPEAMPEAEWVALEDALKKGRGPLERHRVLHAEALAAYFGSPARDLTDAQLYLHARLLGLARDAGRDGGGVKGGKSYSYRAPAARLK